MYIGEPFPWQPAAFEGVSGLMSLGSKVNTLHGHVVYINAAHRYFTVAAEVHGHVLRESFRIGSEPAPPPEPKQKRGYHRTRVLRVGGAE